MLSCFVRLIAFKKCQVGTIVQNIVSNSKLQEFVRKVGRRAEWQLLNFIETAWGFRYNINTVSDDCDPAFPDDQGYHLINYSGLKYIQEKIGLGAQEVLVDIGCGRGRGLCVFSRHMAIARCVGIECQATRVRIA